MKPTQKDLPDIPVGSSALSGSALPAPPAVSLGAATHSACLWPQFLHSRWRVPLPGCPGELSGDRQGKEKNEAALFHCPARDEQLVLYSVWPYAALGKQARISLAEPWTKAHTRSSATVPGCSLETQNF